MVKGGVVIFCILKDKNDLTIHLFIVRTVKQGFLSRRVNLFLREADFNDETEVQGNLFPQGSLILKKVFDIISNINYTFVGNEGDNMG